MTGRATLPATRLAMLRSYVLTALRSFRRHKGYTFINVLGLALGLACAALIALFVLHERSYDRFHEHADRIYRLNYELVDGEQSRRLATSAPPMGPALAQAFPEVERFVRLREPHPSIFSRGERRFYETDFFYADSAFFQAFSFPLRAGDPRTALAAPDAVVLTPEAAERYFGDASPLGQTLTMNDEVELTVTGVMEPPPASSHLQFDFLVSFQTFRVPYGYPVTLDDWRWASFHTYVLLAEGADAAALEAQLPAFLQASTSDERALRSRLRLQPLTGVYLGEPRHPAIAAGNPLYLYGLSTVAVLLLLLACFNFTNLATAHAIRRGKDVSVRKVVGARRGQLMTQYLGESVLLALMALGASLGLAALALRLGPALGWEVPPDGGALVGLLPWLLGLAVLAGLAAGAYPALVLTRFQPARVLKGNAAGLSANSRLRGALVVAQFAIAVALIAGSLVVTQQMRYVQDKELGFDHEQVVALRVRGAELAERYGVLREALLQNPHVVSVSRGGALFDGDQGSVPVYPAGTGGEPLRAMSIYSLDYDFPETMGLELIRGRTPSRAYASDSSAIMLNRTAADLLAASVPGWEDPIGQPLRVGDIMEGPVIGVVEDFHFASLHAEVEPLVLYFPRAHVDQVMVRVRPGEGPALVASLQRDWAGVAPDLPFHHTFLDGHLRQLYRADAQFARLTTAFSFLTAIVAFLGLYGLVTFVTQLRVREVGIRKVLGASVHGLVALLSKRFLAYVLLANALAWPLAYLAMERWLEGFAYRIALGPGPFLAAGGVALALALATVGLRTVRAAMADPVRALHPD